MKKTLIALLLIVPVLALSQSSSPTIKKEYHNSTVILNTTYANNTTDTSGVFYPGAWNIVTLRAATLDSANIAFILHKRAKGQTSWTTVSATAGDTLVQVGGASAANPGYEIVLRNAATDRIGGASTQYRVLAKALTNNGVTTPTYVVRIEYSK
jgi:hypothetical protein